MDLGDTWSVLCVLYESGEVVEQSRVRTRRKEMHAHFGTRSRARVVLEVGTHSPWVSRLLEELGPEVVVANARRLRAIAASQKTDENDAELLATPAEICTSRPPSVPARWHSAPQRQRQRRRRRARRR
jgi:transposase